MTHDVRYAPPQTVVEDVADHRRGPCPKRVSTAMRLLWASFALGTPSLVYQLVATPEWSNALGLLVSTALVLLLYLKIAAGRNWARIVLAALMALSIPVLAFPLEPSPVVLQVLDWGCVALGVVALWLLFTAESASWFRPPRLVT